MRADDQEDNQPQARLVRDAMQTHVVGVVPEMTVRELIHVLLENRISGAPVLDHRGKLAGVVSMTDVLQLAAREAEIPAGQLAWEPVLAAEEMDEDEAGEPGVASGAGRVLPFTSPEAGALPEAAFDQFQVRDIMTPVAFSIRPTDTLGTAIRFLLQGRIHRALVVEGGVLHGIITPFDVLQTLEWE